MTSTGGASTTPTEDAFYLPADTCRHARTWLAWPREEQADLRAPISSLVRQIAEFEPVALATAPGDEASAQSALGAAAEVITLPHTSVRLRDTGPSFLVDGKGGAAAVDWRFNGWGGRASAIPDDEILAHALLGTAEVRRFRAPLTLEPGTFVGDGEDTLIAMAPAVFDPARNPSLARLEAFAIFRHWLGTSRVIWLEDAHPADRLAGDVRALVAFVKRGTVLINHANQHHPHFAALSGINAALSRARAADGAALEIIALPAPPLIEGITVPLSYTSFIALNGAILMPGFGASTDSDAANVLANVFPDRSIKMFPAIEIARAGSTLAALTAPQPARLLERDRATVLPRSAWAQPAPDIDGLLQKYIDLAAKD